MSGMMAGQSPSAQPLGERTRALISHQALCTSLDYILPDFDFGFYLQDYAVVVQFLQYYDDHCVYTDCGVQ